MADIDHEIFYQTAGFFRVGCEQLVIVGRVIGFGVDNPVFNSSFKHLNVVRRMVTSVVLMGTSKNYFFFDASFDTNIYYGFLKT